MLSIQGKKLCEFHGKRIEYATSGQGDPTVIFIHGGGSADMDSWYKVYQLSKKMRRVFAYNRFGDGKSSQAKEPQTGKKVVETLRQLLQHTKVIAPYILVAHSFGGLYANLFARLYPKEVVGVVLVDSSHPDQAKMMHEKSGIADTIYLLFYRIIINLFSRFNPSKSSELNSFDVTASQINCAGAFPDVPLIVITAGKRSTFILSSKDIKRIELLQKDLSAMSPQGRIVIAENSKHCIQDSEPATIVKAINEIIESTNTM